MKWIYAVDFDGLIVENAYPEVGRTKELAKWGINKLHSFGHTIILWTCRVDSFEANAIEHCSDSSIHIDYCNFSAPEIIKAFGKDNRKVFANRYIDDRNPLWCDLIWFWIVFEGWLVSKNIRRKKKK